MPSMCLLSGTGSLPPGADSVLGGARWLRGAGLLARGSRALCGWHGGWQDAGEGVEAVGVNGRDEGQGLHAQRVGGVLAEQGDGGLLRGDEAGGQADWLIRALCQALAGPGTCFRFTDDHQLVEEVRLRLFHSRGVIWEERKNRGTLSSETRLPHEPSAPSRTKAQGGLGGRRKFRGNGSFHFLLLGTQRLINPV